MTWLGDYRQIERLNLASLRILLIFSGAFLLYQGFENWIYGKIYAHPEVVGILLVTYFLSFLLFVFALSSREILYATRHLAFAALIFITITSGYVFTVIEFKGTYRTDSIAFTHYAALQFLEGLRRGWFVNPYTLDLQKAFEAFPVQVYFLTFTQIGDIISRLNYPAMHFLIYLPFIIAGISDMRVVLFLFMILAMLAVYLAAPKEVGPLTLIPFFAGSHLMIKFTSGCVTDPLWILPLTVCVLFMDRPKVAGIFYGLAAGMKQEPWILAPFLVVWYLKERRNVKRRAQNLKDFILYALVTFLLPNLPFIVDAPRDWARGILEPLFGDLVVLSQGLSMLTQMGVYPLGKPFYLVMVVVVTAVLIVNYAVYFEKLQYAVFIFPAIIMWFSYRGLVNYFTSMIPVVTAAFVVWFRHKCPKEEKIW